MLPHTAHRCPVVVTLSQPSFPIDAFGPGQAPPVQCRRHGAPVYLPSATARSGLGGAPYRGRPAPAPTPASRLVVPPVVPSGPGRSTTNAARPGPVPSPGVREDRSRATAEIPTSECPRSFGTTVSVMDPWSSSATGPMAIPWRHGDRLALGAARSRRPVYSGTQESRAPPGILFQGGSVLRVQKVPFTVVGRRYRKGGVVTTARRSGKRRRSEPASKHARAGRRLAVS